MNDEISAKQYAVIVEVDGDFNATLVGRLPIVRWNADEWPGPEPVYERELAEGVADFIERPDGKLEVPGRRANTFDSLVEATSWAIATTRRVVEANRSDEEADAAAGCR